MTNAKPNEEAAAGANGPDAPAPRRLGVFGGTFDPVHWGHLRVAEAAREHLRLDRVLLVPNRVSPFKTGGKSTAGEHRAEMLRLATADNAAFAVWTGEIERAGTSYSVDTVRTLRGENPAAELFFITGADALRDLPKWREPETLLSLARFVGFSRPGVEGDTMLASLPQAWRERIEFVQMPTMDISATAVRETIAAGRSIRYLTPDGVRDYIAAHGLYGEK